MIDTYFSVAFMHNVCRSSQTAALAYLINVVWPQITILLIFHTWPYSSVLTSSPYLFPLMIAEAVSILLGIASL
jgi:hypothetical protein